MDGTNFLQGASDYNYPGMVHYTATTPTAVAALGVATTLGYLCFNQTNAQFPMLFSMKLALTRSGTTKRLDALIQGSAWGTAGWSSTIHRVECMETNMGSALAIKALRFFMGSVFDPESYLLLDWYY
jgi:hypothetical protein